MGGHRKVRRKQAQMIHFIDFTLETPIVTEKAEPPFSNQCPQGPSYPVPSPSTDEGVRRTENGLEVRTTVTAGPWVALMGEWALTGRCSYSRAQGSAPSTLANHRKG